MKALILLVLLGNIETDVKELCAESRENGTVRARDYIIKQLVTATVQEPGNIVAVKRGSGLRHIVIGAHYDSVGPGADDNASGVAIVLELYRRLKRTKHTIVFILFNGEETGLVGSRYYVDNPVLPLKDCDVMLNLDMVGHLSTSILTKPTVDSVLRELFIKYPFAERITLRSGARSDSYPFFQKKVPVIWLFTGTHSRYHTSRDTPDSLNYDGMKQIADYAYDFIIKLDGVTDYNIFDQLEVK